MRSGEHRRLFIEGKGEPILDLVQVHVYENTYDKRVDS